MNANKLVSLAAFSGLVLLVMGILAVVASTSDYKVVLTTDDARQWRLTGSLEFTNTYRYKSASIILDSGKEIQLGQGDRVRIVVDAVNKGKIWIGKNGWMNIVNLRVNAIYVNNVLVAVDTTIEKTSNVRTDLSTLKSSLKLVVSNQGWTSLKVDSKELVRGTSNEYVIVYNIKASHNGVLNLDLGGRFLRAIADGVEYDGNIIGVSEFPFICK